MLSRLKMDVAKMEGAILEAKSSSAEFSLEEGRSGTSFSGALKKAVKPIAKMLKGLTRGLTLRAKDGRGPPERDQGRDGKKPEVDIIR